MITFIADQQDYEVLNRNLHQEGNLCISTRIEVKGNYKKGPVPVSIKYVTLFTPLEEYWEVDPDYPDEEPYSITYRKDFESKEERDFYIKTNFNITSK